MCHGLSDNGLPYPTHTPILKVDFKAHSSEEHHYNVSWKPFVEAELKSKVTKLLSKSSNSYWHLS